MTLGQRIKQRREELQMSQDDLAKKLGYRSRSTINKIELGINDITQHKIVAFAQALKTTPAYLMGWERSTEATKNDIITDIILRLRTDDNLLSLIEDLTKLSEEQLTAVKVFLAAFK